METQTETVGKSYKEMSRTELLTAIHTYLTEQGVERTLGKLMVQDVSTDDAKYIMYCIAESSALYLITYLLGQHSK